MKLALQLIKSGLPKVRPGCGQVNLPGQAVARSTCRARLWPGQPARPGCGQVNLPGQAVVKSTCQARLWPSQPARPGNQTSNYVFRKNTIIIVSFINKFNQSSFSDAVNML